MNVPQPRDLSPLTAQAPWFGEDLRPGDFMALGSVTATREEILDFAQRYDPLPIHVDVELASQAFGDVIAPASLLLAWYSSLASPGFVARTALVAGKGIDHLRIPKPCLAGRRLEGHIRVDEVVHRDARSDVRATSTLVDDLGDVVMAFTSIQVVHRHA